VPADFAIVLIVENLMNVEIRCFLIFVLKTTIEVELAWLQVTGRNTAVLFFFVVL